MVVNKILIQKNQIMILKRKVKPLHTKLLRKKMILKIKIMWKILIKILIISRLFHNKNPISNSHLLIEDIWEL